MIQVVVVPFFRIFFSSFNINEFPSYIFLPNLRLKVVLIFCMFLRACLLFLLNYWISIFSSYQPKIQIIVVLIFCTFLRVSFSYFNITEFQSSFLFFFIKPKIQGCGSSFLYVSANYTSPKSYTNSYISTLLDLLISAQFLLSDYIHIQNSCSSIF